MRTSKRSNWHLPESDHRCDNAWYENVEQYCGDREGDSVKPGSDHWKNFERRVAAIHAAADQGADVRWNEIIEGRQFDVTIRFRKGLYEYLTVVECKDLERPVAIDKVEAFVTKSEDVQAHHAVMASTSGFQEGAQEVARRHNVTLIHVTESSDIDLSFFGAQWGGTTDAFHIQAVELEFTDGEKKLLPLEAHVMTYYVGHVVLQSGSETITLHDLIGQNSSRFHLGEIDEYEEYTIACVAGTTVIGPDDGEIPLKVLATVRIRAGMTNARILTGTRMIEPYFLTHDVKVTNIKTGEEETFSQHGLRLGINTKLTVGTFYEQPALAMYYYCDEISGDIARLYLVESFQLGNLIQAEFTVKTEHANYYVPVNDKSVIARLERRLERLKAKRDRGDARNRAV